MIDCPSCYARVLPRRDGTCPSCGASTALTATPEGDGPYRATSPSGEAARATIDVRSGASVPSLCFQCAASTEDRVHVERTLRRGGIPRWFIVGGALTLVAGVVLLFTALTCGVMLLSAFFFALLGTLRHVGLFGTAGDRGEVSTVVVNVPHCPDCRRTGRLEPTHVDWDQMTMSFIVPRGVAKQIRDE
jgi:hypothetical protein